jgi:hypothetical protein
MKNEHLCSASAWRLNLTAFPWFIQLILPELITALILVLASVNRIELADNCLLFFGSTFLIRLVWNSAILIHGLGHTIAIAIIDAKWSTLNLNNILENRRITDIFKSLLPFQPIFIPWFNQTTSLRLESGKVTPWRIRMKAMGGIALNFVAVAVTSEYWLKNQGNFEFINLFFIQAFIYANLIVIITSISDWEALVTGVAECFYCGNFGFLGQRNSNDSKLLPERVVKMFYQMGHETEIRGEQAGGGLVIARNPENQIVFVGKKVVNKKRENLTQSMETAFAPVRKQAMAQGIKPLESSTMGVWHYRFATSSPPAIIETHWHEWISARTVKVWQLIDNKWVFQPKNVNHRITHNGDFDAWILFGKTVENQELGWWLERVLHTPNRTKGDSPKIAGMMDLLITQGMWDASVRLAYQFVIAESIESAFGDKQPAAKAPNTAPSPQTIANWANFFEQIFFVHKNLFVDSEAITNQKNLSLLENDVLLALNQDNAISKWSEESRIAFVRNAIQAFFYNDLYRATKMFMSRAKGSFGLVTVSTLEPERLVLSAKGQPISVGFNWEEKYLVYASEPAAVDAVLSGKSHCDRLDLDQTTGEVALVTANSIVVYSMNQGRELTPSELDSRWHSLDNHLYQQYLQTPQFDTKDPVASDIQAIPQVLKEIETIWQNPASLNRQSADYLVHLLSEKAQRFEQKRRKMFQAGLISQVRQMPAVDLLITGVENSLWLGEKFAEDLKIIFPYLNVKAISANQVLQDLNQDYSSLHLGKNSLILAITQSGQTFPTVQAINAFDRLCSEGIIGELFILTGELGSFLDSIEGNDGVTAVSESRLTYIANRQRIFVNCSGRRTAETATVTVVAAEQTLTELWLYLAKRLRRNFPDFHAFGMTLTVESLEILEKMKQDFLDKNVMQITGTTATGETIKSSIKQTLIKNGRQWANHITEMPLAWAIHALYILITVGWAIPFGYTIPLVKTLMKLVTLAANLPQDWFLLKLLNPMVILADIGIYIFGAWLWTLGLRYFQGRQLLARIGKRTLVIGDVFWVNQLLKSYVSKLFALSYGIASLEVHGADPKDHLLHDFAHRVVRGTLIFLGIPDGRRGEKQQQDENAVILAGKQASGVRHMNVGPEIMAIGHNPKISQQGFQHAIVLPSNDDSLYYKNQDDPEQETAIALLRESCFGALERLIASYVFFWALAKKVASLPLLKYQYWKSQSRTKIMTTAAPIPGVDPKKYNQGVNLAQKTQQSQNITEKQPNIKP